MSVEDLEPKVQMEDDYDDGDSEDEGGDVQLGFIDKTTQNELFNDCDWRNWDGGKVGGSPVCLLVIMLCTCNMLSLHNITVTGLAQSCRSASH